MNDSFDALFDAAGRQYNVDPQLIKTIFHIESSGNPNTRDSEAGAQGGMQLMPATARGLGVTDARDMRQAIPAAARYLAQGLDREGSAVGAAHYYFGGPDKAQWGPKTAAYGIHATQLYPTMAIKTRAPAEAAQAAPAAPKVSDDEAEGERIFKALTAPRAAPAEPAAPAAQSADEAEGERIFKALTAPKPAPPEQAGPAVPTSVLAPTQAAPPPTAPYRDMAPGSPGSTPTYPDMTPTPPAPPSATRMYPPIVPEAPAVAAAIGRGLAEGWGPEPLGMSPESRAGLEKLGVVGPPGGGSRGQIVAESVLNPLYTAADTGMRGANALFRGAQGGVAQMGAELGAPLLGRDLAAFPEVLLPHVPGAPARPAPPPTNPLLALADRHSARLAAPLSDEFRDAPGVTRPSMIGPTEPNPAIRGRPAEAAAPVERPGAVGADVTSEPIPDKTRAQELRDMQTAVLQTAEDRLGPSMRDDTVWIPGVRRTLATREMTPENALDHKHFMQTDRAYRTSVEQIEKQNNEVMRDAYAAHAGDPIALARAYEDREAVSPTAMRVFDAEKPVDAAPILTEINRVRSSPEGRIGAVRKVFDDLEKSLLREGDDLAAMSPAQLYGFRKDITARLRKGATGAGDEAADIRTAKALLEGLIPAVDETIGKGAPKFGEYLAAWREASQPIDQMELLQRYLTGAGKIVNDQGYLQPGKVQKLLTDIYAGQQARGPNKYKSVTPEQIATIEGIRNELAYTAYRDRLASARGSDTAQNLAQGGLVGTGLRAAGEVGLHMALGATTGGAGNAALLGVRQILGPMREAAKSRREARTLADRKAALLMTQDDMPAGGGGNLLGASPP